MRADSLKTEEKTKLVELDIERRTNPTTRRSLRLNPPMHQLGTGSNRVGRMSTND